MFTDGGLSVSGSIAVNRYNHKAVGQRGISSVLIVNGSGIPSLTDRRLLPRNVKVSCCAYPGPRGAAAFATVAAVILEVDRADSAEAALQFVRAMHHTTRILLLVRDSSEQLAIAALNAGASRYVTSRAPAGEFHEALEAVLTPGTALAPVPRAAAECRHAERFIGDSVAMRQLRGEIARTARCDSNILITGETGTGKELVAELIHENSPRRHEPFVCLNSTAIPDTLIESELFGYERGAFTGAVASSIGKLAAANGGSVFFDEIGDISMSLQAKLLRALDGKTVYRLGGNKPVPLDVRVVAATNQDLERAVHANRFRNDLYYRLNVIRLEVPPLRERPEDVLALVTHFIAAFNPAFGTNVTRFSDQAVEALVRHDWPGNVRELRNVVEAAFANLEDRDASVVTLPAQFRRTTAATNSERAQIVSALMSTNWNKSKAAEQLQWSRMTLYRKLNRLKIQLPPR
jgi:DNA-binding NtrC family response regulator